MTTKSVFDESWGDSIDEILEKKDNLGWISLIFKSSSSFYLEIQRKLSEFIDPQCHDLLLSRTTEHTLKLMRFIFDLELTNVRLIFGLQLAARKVQKDACQ
jgi:hypothetical protein